MKRGYHLSVFTLTISLVSLSLFASCQKDPQEILSDLQQQIAELPVAGGARQEAIEDLLADIDDYENDENEKYIEVLLDSAEGGLFEQSGDSSVIVARTGSGWLVLHAGDQNQFSEGDDPLNFSLSFHGRYIVYAASESETTCRFSWIDLGEARNGSNLEEDFLKGDCQTPVIAADDGSVYYAKDSDVFLRSMTGGAEQLVLGRSFFKSTYPKISNRIHLITLPDGIWILYGAAGSYDLYHYSGVPGTARKVYPGIASPLVQQSSPGLFAPPTTVQNPLLFLYTGEAGRYRLQGFSLPTTTWKSFQIPVRRNVTYLADDEQFLYVTDAYPVRYVTATGKENRLPLRVRRVFAHPSGLIYLDEKYRLILRREPYSEFEKKLFQMKEELELNLRQ